MQDLNDPLVQKVALSLLFLTTFVCGLLSFIHYSSPNPRILDLIAPPINFFINLFLIIQLYNHPTRLKRVFRIWLISSLTTLTISIWYFIIKVALSPNLLLSEELPPVGPGLLLIYLTLSVFARPDEVLKIGVISWIFIALPVLLYLGLHPKDLLTPRGTEIFMMLGPAMIFALVIFEFNKIMEKKIKSLHHEREQMEFLAARDALTHLYNRRGINPILARILQESYRNWGVIMFDIDHFKKINDQYGHDMGDVVLLQVAKRCQETLNPDDIIARWGGEEFLILIQNMTQESLIQMAENLKHNISRNPIDSLEQVTASFGVTQLKPTDSIDTLLKRVDEAMYIAKKQGRNRVIWQ